MVQDFKVEANVLIAVLQDELYATHGRLAMQTAYSRQLAAEIGALKHELDIRESEGNERNGA